MENFHHDCLTHSCRMLACSFKETCIKLSFSRLSHSRMSLQTRELSGGMLLGLSDTAYAFACKFGTIRLHSVIPALVLFRNSLGYIFRGGVFPPYQFHANCRQMAAFASLFETSHLPFWGGPCKLFTPILLSKFYYTLYRSFSSQVWKPMAVLWRFTGQRQGTLVAIRRRQTL